jgi:small subunit ribosomal protein S21
MTEVRIRKGEPIDKVLRKLKKKMDKEGTLRDLRNRRYYEKPSEAKRRSRKSTPSLYGI